MAEASDIVWPFKTRELHNHHMNSTVWNDFKFRDDDIIIATYAKSGTTWTQQILAQLIFNGAEGQDVSALSPWVDLRVMPPEAIAGLEHLPHRRFVKTHLPVDALVFSPRAKYIYIGRDGRDVVWSMYNHHANANALFYEILNQTPGHVGEPIAPPPSSIRDYYHAWLDRDGHAVRIRLDSTCMHVKSMPSGAELAYIRHGEVHRVKAAHTILACFNMAIPYMMPELPEEQRHALLRNVKAPLVYTKVLVRNWKAFANLGVHEISGPMSFHSRVKLDYPVSMGGYRHPRDPSEPIGLHLVHVPNESNPGMEARDQFRIGRMQLLDMTFADFEKRIHDELGRMLGPGGFESNRDIAAIYREKARG